MRGLCRIDVDKVSFPRTQSTRGFRKFRKYQSIVRELGMQEPSFRSPDLSLSSLRTSPSFSWADVSSLEPLSRSKRSRAAVVPRTLWRALRDVPLEPVITADLFNYLESRFERATIPAGQIERQP